jgi:hypothetical protein
MPVRTGLRLGSASGVGRQNQNRVGVVRRLETMNYPQARCACQLPPAARDRRSRIASVW